MKKSIRRITALLVAALASLSLVFLVACGDTADTKEYYKLKVVYDANNEAVNGTTEGKGGTNETSIAINICDAQNNDSCFRTQYLGADGTYQIEKSVLKAGFGATVPNSFSIHLEYLPDGYKHADDYVFDEDTDEVTIRLIAITYYTVTVKTNATTAATGVNVAFMNSGTPVKAAAAVDTNGQIKYDRDEIVGSTITLSNLTDGYKAPGGTLTVLATDTEKEIILTKITYYTVTVTMPDGAAAKGVQVAFMNGATPVKAAAEVDDNGQIKYDRDEIVGSTIVLSGVSSMYNIPSSEITVLGTETSATIQLTDATPVVTQEVAIAENSWDMTKTYTFVAPASDTGTFELFAFAPALHTGEFLPIVYDAEDAFDGIIDYSGGVTSYIFELAEGEMITFYVVNDQCSTILKFYKAQPLPPIVVTVDEEAVEAVNNKTINVAGASADSYTLTVELDKNIGACTVNVSVNGAAVSALVDDGSGNYTGTITLTGEEDTIEIVVIAPTSQVVPEAFDLSISITTPAA